jgi:hypothetical protein
VTSIPRSSSTPTITPTSQFTPTPAAACIALSRKLADTNNDGVINNIDLSDLSKDWKKTTAQLLNPATDFNCDGIVDLTDFLILARMYGQ